MRGFLLFASSLLSVAECGEYADKAADEVEEVCTDIANWEDNKLNDLNGRLVDRYAGDDNEVIAMIIDPECNADSFGTCLQSHQSGVISTAIKAVLPIVFPIIMIILWLLFFMPCACCRCCRRCPVFCCCREDREARNFGKTKKVVFGIWAVLYIAGFIVAAVFGVLSSGQMKEGADGAICEVYKFVDATLNGAEAEADVSAFIGLNNAVNQFSDLTNTLDANGQFLGGVEALVTDTVDIENAIKKLSSTLSSVKKTLSQNDVITVGDYKCVFCEQSGASMDAVIAALDNSAAGALNSVRATVKEQLTGQTVVDTRSTLESSRSPVEEIGKAIEDSLGKLFIDNRERVQNSVDTAGMIAMIVSLTVILPGLLLLTTTTCGVCCSRRETFRDPAVVPQNACHASCSWCVTCLWSFLVLLVGSVVLFVGFLSASSCIIMQDIDTYIPDLLGKTDSDQATKDQMVDIVRTCFSEDGDGDFTSSITVDGKTLKEALDVSGIVNSQFDALDEVLNNNIGSFSNDPDFTSFLAALRDFGAVYSLSDPDATINDASPNAATYPTLVEKFVGAQAACGNVLVDFTQEYTADMVRTLGFNPDTDTQVTIPGMDAYFTQAGVDTIDLGYPTCAQHVAPTANTGAGDEVGFRRLADRAMAVRTKNDFTCYAVTFSTNADGEVEATEADGPCGGTGSFDDYQAYVAQSVTDLQTAVAAIDTATASTQSDISDGLKTLVNEAFVEPMDVIVEGINCQFIGVRWTEMLNALCRTAVPGLMTTAFCWIALGGIAWAVILMEFRIWRRLKDNRCLWEDEVRRQRA